MLAWLQRHHCEYLIPNTSVTVKLLPDTHWSPDSFLKLNRSLIECNTDMRWESISSLFGFSPAAALSRLWPVWHRVDWPIRAETRTWRVGPMEPRPPQNTQVQCYSGGVSQFFSTPTHLQSAIKTCLCFQVRSFSKNRASSPTSSSFTTLCLAAAWRERSTRHRKTR